MSLLSRTQALNPPDSLANKWRREMSGRGFRCVSTNPETWSDGKTQILPNFSELDKIAPKDSTDIRKGSRS